MIALFRWVTKHYKKEVKILSTYNRLHRHFFWFIALDALVSILVVVLAFQIFGGSNNPLERALGRAGAVGMTVDRLSDLVLKDQPPVYWLGPIAGESYSHTSSIEDVVVISYVPNGDKADNSKQVKLTVTTYENSQVYEGQLRPSVNFENLIVVAGKGFTVSYDSKSMKFMRVTMSRAPQVIVVTYPTRQSSVQLLHDAAKLSVID